MPLPLCLLPWEKTVITSRHILPLEMTLLFIIFDEKPSCFAGIIRIGL